MPAIGEWGAVPKALQTSQCASTASAKFNKGMLPPPESAKTIRSCCAAACSQFTCTFVEISSGSAAHQSRASLKVTDLHARKGWRGSRRHIHHQKRVDANRPLINVGVSSQRPSLKRRPRIWGISPISIGLLFGRLRAGRSLPSGLPPQDIDPLFRRRQHAASEILLAT